AEDGIRDFHVTGVQTCALPIYLLHFAPCQFSCKPRIKKTSYYQSMDSPLFASRPTLQKPPTTTQTYDQHWTAPTPPTGSSPRPRSEERRVGKERRTQRTYTRTK